MSPYNDGYIYNYNDAGTIFKTINLKNTIPSSLLPAKSSAVSFTLNSDKTKLYIAYDFGNRIFSLDINGNYLGYSDFLTNDVVKFISGMTTDGENMWLCVTNFLPTFTMYKVDENFNVLSSFSQTVPYNADCIRDITFDKYNFAPYCAIALRLISVDEGNYNMFVVAYQVPCPGSQPCNEPPVINAKNRCLTLESTFDPMQNVSSFDCDGSNITSEIKIIKNTVNTSKVGTYLVSYQVTSLINGKIATKDIKVTVIGKDSRHQAITDIIETVALEQTAISHILNAEGEKIQKAIELAENKEQLFLINDSVKDMVHSLSTLEQTLQTKLSLFEDCLNCHDKECEN